jgi:hypothetical protein
MTVRELIDLLSKLPPDMQVYYGDYTRTNNAIDNHLHQRVVVGQVNGKPGLVLKDYEYNVHGCVSLEKFLSGTVPITPAEWDVVDNEDDGARAMLANYLPNPNE